MATLDLSEPQTNAKTAQNIQAIADVMQTFIEAGTALTATAAELNYLDITTLGTGAASKAVVLDSGEDYIWPATGQLTYGGTAITATGAEINLLDGSSATSPAASTAAILDSAGALRTAENIGTVGTNCTVVEYGDGYQHVSAITLSSVAYTIGDNAALADGALIYTFPAGVIQINGVTASLGLTLTSGTPTTDTPEIGLGTVIGSGVNATLGDVGAGAEDIAGPAVMDDVAGTAEIFSNTTPQIIAAAGVHLVHVNIADTWADVTDTAATMSGTVYINWTFLGA